MPRPIRPLICRLRDNLRDLSAEMHAPPPRPRRAECLQAVLRDMLALAEAAAADDAADEDMALALSVLEPAEAWTEQLCAMIEAIKAPD